MLMNVQVGDKLYMKKSHPCGSNCFEVLRVGADFRLRCCGCGHEIMAARARIEKNVRRIETPENKE